MRAVDGVQWTQRQPRLVLRPSSGVDRVLCSWPCIFPMGQVITFLFQNFQQDLVASSNQEKSEKSQYPLYLVRFPLLPFSTEQNYSKALGLISGAELTRDVSLCKGRDTLFTIGQPQKQCFATCTLSCFCPSSALFLASRAHLSQDLRGYRKSRSDLCTLEVYAPIWGDEINSYKK